MKAKLSLENKQEIQVENRKIIPSTEESVDKESKSKILEKPIQSKSVIIPSKKRKKMHPPGNKDLKLEIHPGNEDSLNKVIVS